MEKKQLFRQSSMDRAMSPDQLNDYIKVANPGLWMILCAVLVLLAALLVWSALGTLPTTIDEIGIVSDGVMTCYMEDIDEIAVGMEVKIGDHAGTITEISDIPYSSREVAELYNDDYTVHILGVEDWNYRVLVDVPGVSDGLAESTIVTGEVHPITFMFN